VTELRPEMYKTLNPIPSTAFVYASSLIILKRAYQSDMKLDLMVTIDPFHGKGSHEA
jgi:hypothetical protein